MKFPPSENIWKDYRLLLNPGPVRVLIPNLGLVRSLRPLRLVSPDSPKREDVGFPLRWVSPRDGDRVGRAWRAAGTVAV